MMNLSLELAKEISTLYREAMMNGTEKAYKSYIRKLKNIVKKLEEEITVERLEDWALDISYRYSL